MADIANFFASVGRTQVTSAYSGLGFPDSVAQQLTGLTFFNGLPQGAPSSPMLSSLIAYHLDRELIEIANRWGATYTRYADDLAFSGDHHFTALDISTIGSVLNDHGFELNERKTRIVGGGHRHAITGLSTTVRALPYRKKRRAWRALFHQADRDPAAFRHRAAELLGIAAFVYQYDPDLAARYRATGNRVAQVDC